MSSCVISLYTYIVCPYTQYNEPSPQIYMHDFGQAYKLLNSHDQELLLNNVVETGTIALLKKPTVMVLKLT